MIDSMFSKISTEHISRPSKKHMKELSIFNNKTVIQYVKKWGGSLNENEITLTNSLYWYVQINSTILGKNPK